MSGDKNEEQVLNAIEAYTEHRPEITSRAINLLFDIARIERCNQPLRALQVTTAYIYYFCRICIVGFSKLLKIDILYKEGANL